MGSCVNGSAKPDDKGKIGEKLDPKSDIKPAVPPARLTE